MKQILLLFALNINLYKYDWVVEHWQHSNGVLPVSDNNMLTIISALMNLLSGARQAFTHWITSNSITLKKMEFRSQ